MGQSKELSKMTPEEIEANYRLWNGYKFKVISNDNGSVLINTDSINVRVREDSFNLLGFRLIPKIDFSELKAGDPVFVWDADRWDFKCRVFLCERNGYAVCLEDDSNKKWRFCEKIADMEEFLND